MEWKAYPDRTEVSLDALAAMVGDAVYSDPVTIDQAMIDAFASATGDDAFIHVDPEAAARTRFGGTIAHGLLLLSLMPYMLRSATPLLRNSTMGVNYGYEGVRFVTPVKCGSIVKGRFMLAGVETRATGLTIVRYDAAIEVEGHDKPALVASWLLGRWIAADG